MTPVDGGNGRCRHHSGLEANIENLATMDARIERRLDGVESKLNALIMLAFGNVAALLVQLIR